jgi:hypothetical protein
MPSILPYLSDNVRLGAPGRGYGATYVATLGDPPEMTGPFSAFRGSSTGRKAPRIPHRIAVPPLMRVDTAFGSGQAVS